jgi:hypothetical protein
VAAARAVAARVVAAAAEGAAAAAEGATTAGEGEVGRLVVVATALVFWVMEVGASGGGLEAACPVVGALVEAAAAEETEGYRSTRGTPHTW